MFDFDKKLHSLNEQFAIKDVVVFDQKDNQQIVIKITNQFARAEIMLQGAHLIDWRINNKEPIIWLSDDAVFAKSKSIRGGIPICWPWFGAHSVDKSLVAHGYARTVLWDVIKLEQLSDGRTKLVFRLLETAETKKLWPHSCSLDIVYIIGNTLQIDLITANTSADTISITEALHTYFHVGDVCKVEVTGLEDCYYLDKPDNFAHKQQTGSVRVGEEVDRIYLNTTTDVKIHDPVLDRCISIKKSASESTIVWNPWDKVAAKMGDLGSEGYLSMLCIESANADRNAITLLAGDSHCLSVEYSITHE